MDRIIIFGTGTLYQKYKNRFSECNVIALIDNSEDKQGMYVDGIRISSVSILKEVEFDFVVILVKEYQEIYRQLQNEKIDNSKIITIDPNGRFSEYRKLEGQILEKADILLVSHEMNIRGAPLMLLRLAQMLKALGISIEIAYTNQGKLENYCTELGIPTVYFDDFNFSKDEISKYFREYKVVIVNTLVLGKLAMQLADSNIPVIWWLHEEWSAYDILKPDKKIKWDDKCVEICAVGKRAANAFSDYYGVSKKIENLQWSIDESVATKKGREYGKIVFGVVGEVTYIKGQDLLFDVIGLLNREILDRIEFWIIGKIDDEQKNQFENNESIKVFGEMDHQMLLEKYAEIDIVLSTSRNDTMPVVLVEGMMNRKIIMTSTGTGVSDYICNHVNGIVYESEDTQGMKKEIEWIVNNYQDIDYLGKNAYELYLEKFSNKQFLRQIEKIVSKYIGEK